MINNELLDGLKTAVREDIGPWGGSKQTAPTGAVVLSSADNITFVAPRNADGQKVFMQFFSDEEVLLYAEMLQRAVGYRGSGGRVRGEC